MPEQPYPVAPRADVVDDYHGELVADPYRPLEDTDAPATVAWVAAQNARTERFLAKVATREAIRSRLTELWDFPRYGVPFERGGKYFQFRNSGLQNQPVLYVTDEPGEEGHVLLDPNALSADGTVAVTGLEVTEDGMLLAYATSAGGSDWMTWRVREVSSGRDRDDLVEWSKFSGASWRKDGSGFYYGAMARPSPGAELLEQNRVPKVCFHRLGAPQSEDEVVFEAPDEPEWIPHAEVSDDDRYLIVSIGRGTFPETQIHVLDLERPDAGFLPLVPDFSAKSSVITNLDKDFYLLTDEGAERQHVVLVNLDRPERFYWREIVPETEDTLLEVREFGGRLVCHYLQHAHSMLSVHQYDGAWVRDVPLPGIVTVSGMEGRRHSAQVRFQVTSFTESGALWFHDLRSGETVETRASGAHIESDFVTEQVFAESDDGTLVPVFLTRRPDVEPNGDIPVLLYGYGGFDVPITPSFSVTQAVFVERGGLLAVANLRGGGEYGRRWYEEGRLANKQNVFDDFCAVARHLVASRWTRAERIAINGGSNGGLLVGACLVQHPELFGAAVPEVGVLDLLRFHKFTIGWAWTSDYGDPDDPEQYRWPRSYSPLHNIVEGARYPATLVMTGDHDDRVVPGHSFKFAAALQAAQGGDAPVLIRVETAAGHGAGKPTAKAIAERTDVLTFLDATIGPSRPD